MATFLKRSSARQRRVFRAVAGAVENVRRAHPEWIQDSRAAGSVTKRAAGTLTAAWPEVLAVSPRWAPSERGSRVVAGCPATRNGESLSRGGGRGSLLASAPIRSAVKRLSLLAGRARREGQGELLEGLVEVLRILAP